MKKKYYHDAYGCTASIGQMKNGGFRLRIRSDLGKLMHNKTYGTFRGARTALGRWSDDWEEN